MPESGPPVDTDAARLSLEPLPVSAPLKGPDLILAEARGAPDKPGVYRMLGAEGEVLYVGKARSLKKRILQYAQGRFHTQRIARMVHLTEAMVLVTTQTEGEALLLEARLIKALKPRYNVLLRDDKSFAEILVRRDHAAVQIRKHRGARTIKGDYYGPFASTWAVNRTLDTLQKAFLLRTCTDSVYEGRTRPCMLHQIKRCAAPCTGEISLEAYNALADQADLFLKGKSRAVIDALSAEMMAASEAMAYETAAQIRDRVRALTSVAMQQSIGLGEEEADVFAVAIVGGQACVQTVFYRAGQNWGDRAYFPRIDKSHTEAEVLDAFLGQFYQDRPVPRLVLVSHPLTETTLLEEALSLKATRKITITWPQRGEKKEVIDHALTNAREALGRRLAEGAAQAQLLEGVAETFGLVSVPERIEVYDNSHVMGTNAVGGMIVAGPEGFQKSQYRKFTIKNADLVPGDDYGMMREVLTRRFGRLQKERANGESPPVPDLVLVDGGQGQLDVAREVFAALDIHDIAVIGVAKGPDRDAGLERFFMPGRSPFMLEKKSPVLYFLQRLRDEAHRYAIGTHRQKRAAAMIRNPLDEIDGIGPTRKRALLQAFGSAKAVGRAEVADLVKVPGVNQAMAERIYAHFRG